MQQDALPAREAIPSKGAGGPSNGGSEAELRDGAMEGVLVAAGELGYRETSVRSILEHSGWHRVQFYKHFDNREDCFARAYAAWIDRLCIDLLQAAAAVPGWEAGVRAALVELFRFASERPAIARAIFVEVQIAGEPALARHEAAVERLAAAIDSVRAEIEPEEAPPEATATFVVGGIESTLAETLSGGDPKRIWDALPELMHFVVGSYLGRDAAEEAFETASELLARNRAEWAGERE